MTYSRDLFALTRYFSKLSMQPESSNGFASVGTVLPSEEAALLPGGLFLVSEAVANSGIASRPACR
jgi:hypothetical protein